MGTRRKTYTTCSVVMAVYKNDRPDWFFKSMESILAQTMKSDDIIVVVDGPIPAELEKIVDIYGRIYPEITVKKLARNLGAGPARNIGIGLAKNPLVAIQDADDVSLPNRFALELAAFDSNTKLALVGGQLAEFENDDPRGGVTSYRHVPLEYDDIVRFARRRMPVNGASCIFNKYTLQEAGGYGNTSRGEDYVLVAKLIASGCWMTNVPEVVYMCRVSRMSYVRRKKLGHFANFIATRWQVKRLGVSGYMDFLLPCLAQLCLLVMPANVTQVVYKRMLRK